MTYGNKALPIDTAPKNNTLVRLLVDYSGEGEHPLEDAVQAWTIGFNNFEDSEIDEWQFAGWSWSQDRFCEGQGRVIGWAPFHPETRLYDATAPIADGGGAPMTSAEEVLAWILVEKIGVPDDVSYSPDQAQRIIADRLAQTPPSQTHVVGDLDYCFDPEDWEFTCSWSERDQVHGYGENLMPGHPMRVCTLLKGPDKWVADVPITWDEDGEPDETEIKWFDSEEEARAALATTEGKDNG